jgi:hypothetical protein
MVLVKLEFLRGACQMQGIKKSQIRKSIIAFSKEIENVKVVE